MSWTNPKVKSPVPPTAPITKATCPLCKGPVYKNARGEILGHTRGGYTDGRVCDGGKRGARP